MKHQKCILTIISLLLLSANLFSQTLSERIRFASLDTAKMLITQKDDYVNGWSKFDIHSRTGKQDATVDDQLAFAAEQVQEWTQYEKSVLLRIANRVDNAIKEQGLKLPFPDEIYILKTTGDEEGGAAGYTRENYMVLKRADYELFVHELFHILTRNDSSFRARLYATMGFKLMPPIPFPESNKIFKISNPDVPYIDNYITVKKDGKNINCTILLYSTEEYKGGPLVYYFNIGILLLDKKKQIVYKDGEPVIYPFHEVEELYRKINANTNYVIAIEEVLADNFYFVITNETELTDQWLVDEMRAEMQK